ncbi:MAG: efflux RND transporter permease subunit [Bacteroidetes bacterium]|nr:efflux RND transporter permease subunit [Bacteroidota bacterium]
MSIVPFIASKILKNHHQPEGNIFHRALKKVINLSYSRLMRWSLKNPVKSLMITGAIVAASLAVVPRMGFSLFPKSEKPQFSINIEMPNSASFEETDLVARDVEKMLGANPKITYYTTNIGKGNPMVYYNVAQHGQQANFAQIFVQCHVENWEEKNELIQQIREQVQQYPKAKIHVLDYEQGPPLEAPVAIRIFGDNLDTLRSLSYAVEDIISSVPVVIDISNSVATQTTGLQVRINKEKAGMIGVSIADIQRTLHIAIAGLKVGEIDNDLGGDKLPINVKLARERFPTVAMLNHIYVNSMTGRAVPLNHIADVEMEISQTAIRHLNKNRYVTVNAFAGNGHVYNDLNTAVIKKMNQLTLPRGYRWEAAGELENKQRSFEGFGTIIILTVFAFIGALVLEFGSLKSASIVLSVIPLGAVGGVLALFVTGNTFSFTALIGFIALTGIEIKNSILLVDYTNQLREQGMPLDEAIEKSGETRFIPILLTTMTAIGGLIPLIVEPAPLYTPLAIVLVGGLTSSLLLSRIVTPVLYKLMPPTM